MTDMLAVHVDPQRRPLSFADAAEAMEAALCANLGHKPSLTCLALALAKCALETGRWACCWNHNWGNIKAGPLHVGMFTCITLNEVLPEGTIWFSPAGRLAGGPGTAVISESYAVPPGHPQTRIRAYANRYDGAYSYVDFVSEGRYRRAWQELLQGEPRAYVHALKAAGYFTAPEESYAKGVVSIHAEFEKRLRGFDCPKHEPTDFEWEQIKASILGRPIWALVDAVNDLTAEGMSA